MPYLEADELTDIAEYYMTGNQDDKANQAIRAAINMHPDSVDPQIFLARQKMFYGKLDEARSIIDAITEQDDCEVIYLQAELLIKEKKPDEASAFLLEQTDMMHDCLDNYLYDCVSIFMDYDQWEQADEWLARLRDAFPAHPSIPIMEAEIQMGLDNYEEALPMLQKILDEEPYNSECWSLLAETHVALEQYVEARDAADYALAINPEDMNALLMKANSYMQEGEMSEAITHYTKYLEQQPDDISVSLSLAICYSSEDRYKEMLPLLEKTEQTALKLPERETDISQILQLRAIALSHLNRKSEAISAIEKAREFCEESEMWRCDMTQANVFLQANEPETAEDYFCEALDKAPEKGDTLFNIALSYSNAGFYDVAIDLLCNVWTLFGTEDGKFVVPYIANCYLNKFRETPENHPQRKEFVDNFLLYLQLSPSCDENATYILFHDRFPGLEPKDYYDFAFKEIYGTFPDGH